MTNRRDVLKIKRLDYLVQVLTERFDVHVNRRPTGRRMTALIVTYRSELAFELVNKISNRQMRGVQPMTKEKRLAVSMAFVLYFRTVFHRQIGHKLSFSKSDALKSEPSAIQ